MKFFGTNFGPPQSAKTQWFAKSTMSINYKNNYRLLKFPTKMQPLHQKYERETGKLCHVNMLEMKWVFPSWNASMI